MDSSKAIETLYVNNLDEKVSAAELRTNLFFLFVPFGEIQGIIVRKSKALRGQAFVVFKTSVASSMALKTLQGCNFLGKTLRIDFARQRSVILKRINGEVVPAKKQPFKYNPHLLAQSTEEAPGEEKEEGSEGDKGEDVPVKKVKEDEADKAEESNVLLLQDLPEYITADMLVVLFSQFPGFKDQRLIPEKQLAMVEFEKVSDASTAFYGLNNFKLDEHNILKMSFAKF